MYLESEITTENQLSKVFKRCRRDKLTAKVLFYSPHDPWAIHLKDNVVYDYGPDAPIESTGCPIYLVSTFDVPSWFFYPQAGEGSPFQLLNISEGRYTRGKDKYDVLYRLPAIYSALGLE